MTAYVVVDIAVTDSERDQEYVQLAPASLETFGGSYIVRGGKTQTLEGDWRPTRLVILRFDSVDRAKAWLTSPGYAPARAIRHAAATTNMIVVEGA